MSKAKVTITANQIGGEASLRVLLDIERTLKRMEGQLRSYDKRVKDSVKNSEWAEERLKALRYKNATAIDANLKKELATVSARNKVALASTDLASKEERLVKLKRDNASAVDMSVQKMLNEHNALNTSAKKEWDVVKARESAKKAVYDRNVRIDESTQKLLNEHNALNRSAVLENNVTRSRNAAKNAIESLNNKKKQGSILDVRTKKINEDLIASQKRKELATLRLKNAQDQVNKSVQSSTKSWLKHVTTVASGIVVYQAIRAAMSGVVGVIRGSIKAVSDYQQSVISMAALYTTFAKDQSDIAETYRSNRDYTEQLIPTLMEIDKYTSLNLDQLLQVNTALARQRVALTLNNDAQKQGYINIANAIAVLTKGQGTAKQIAQEIRALLTGKNVREGVDLLAGVLKDKIGPEYQKQIKQWQEIGRLQGDSGYVLEKIGKLLTGFTPASREMEGTWESIMTSLQATFQILAIEGMTPVLEDWVRYLKQFNDYLRENKDEIANAIKNAWGKMEKIAIAIYQNWGMVKLALESIIAYKIIQGFLLLNKTIIASRVAVLALSRALSVNLVIATGGIAGVFMGIVWAIDQMNDKTSWLRARIDNLANSFRGLKAAMGGEITWWQYLTANAEELKRLIGDGQQRGASGSWGGSTAPEPMANPTGDDEADKTYNKMLERRSTLLMRWTNEAQRAVDSINMLASAEAVEGKVREYNDRLRERGFAALSANEEARLTALLKEAEHAKKVQISYNAMYEDVNGITEDWLIAQEAVNRLLEDNNITVEQAERIHNKYNLERQKGLNPLYDEIRGLEQEVLMLNMSASAAEQAAYRFSVLNKLRSEGLYSDNSGFADDATKAIYEQAMALYEQKRQLEDNNSMWLQMEDAIVSYGDTFASTMNDVVWGAKTSFKEVLSSFLKMLTEIVIQTQIVKPLLSGLFGNGAAFSGGEVLKNARGNAFLGGSVVPFATGGIVTKPTFFPMANGMGLMGEDGPEAVMPLTQTSGGKLGVQSVGNQTPNVILNIENNTGSKIEQKNTKTSFNGKDFVITTVLEAASSNKNGFRDAMKSIVK